MAINRTRAWLLAGALELLLVCAVRADQPDTPQPGGVAEAPFVDDVQIFSPGDFSTYGSGPHRNQGWFGGWEALRWGISVPNKTDIGNPFVSGLYFDGATSGNVRNSLNTGIFGTGYEAGFRWEGGYVNGDRGWLFSAFRLYDNNQRFLFNNVKMKWDSIVDPITGASMLQGFTDLDGDGFDDNYNGTNFQFSLFDPVITSTDLLNLLGIVPPANVGAVYGRDGIDLGTNNPMPPPPTINNVLDGLPDTLVPTDYGDLVTFEVRLDQASILQHTEVWGTEADRLFLIGPTICGGAWEVLGGIRYFKFDERFNINTTGGILANSFWHTRAVNNMVGGQVGLRGVWKRGRLNLTTEGRFMAGANIQQLTQRGEIASQATPGVAATNPGQPLLLQPTAFTHASRQTEFAPLGELRVGIGWNIFRSVQLKAGWTGIIVGNVARPSYMVEYKLPYMGILEDNNRQEVFIQGLTLGLDVNH